MLPFCVFRHPLRMTIITLALYCRLYSLAEQ
jgi:hypothetical protein